MKGIPPEIDTLLWAVAEDESPKAGDEFVARYPKYAGELARRRRMVQGLKGGRPMASMATQRARPAFRPAPVRSQPIPRRTLVGVGALVLAAIAVASYTATTFMTPQHRPTPNTQVVDNTPVSPTPPPVKQEEPPINVVPDSQVQNPPIQDPAPVVDPRQAKGHDFKVKRADLAGALTMLGAEAGVNIIVAPGMAKRTIDAEYENTPLNEILTDLGRRFGFTPFDQGDGSIIIVPATENGAAESSEPSGRPINKDSIERRSP